jgi:hypothetical protein
MLSEIVVLVDARSVAGKRKDLGGKYGVGAEHLNGLKTES